MSSDGSPNSLTTEFERILAQVPPIPENTVANGIQLWKLAIQMNPDESQPVLFGQVPCDSEGSITDKGTEKCYVARAQAHENVDSHQTVRNKYFDMHKVPYSDFDSLVYYVARTPKYYDRMATQKIRSIEVITREDPGCETIPLGHNKIDVVIPPGKEWSFGESTDLNSNPITVGVPKDLPGTFYDSEHINTNQHHRNTWALSKEEARDQIFTAPLNGKCVPHIFTRGFTCPRVDFRAEILGFNIDGQAKRITDFKRKNPSKDTIPLPGTTNPLDTMYYNVFGCIEPDDSS